jgi:cell division protein FtsB
MFGYVCILIAQCVAVYNLVEQNKELRKEVYYKQLEVNVCLINMKRMAYNIQELEKENEELDDENDVLFEEMEKLHNETSVLESFMADVYTTIYAEHQKKKKIKNLKRKIKNREKK